MEEFGSKDIASIAIKTALTKSRNEENELKQQMLKLGVHCCAIDFGGEFISSVNKMVERSVVGAKREGLIESTHLEEGAIAGATREALAQLMNKAIGLNVGGKIGIARFNEHLAVCIFCGIGLLHLNEVAIGLGHRVV
ncbi:MAG: HutP family protein [Bacillota bacterium]|nr:HutP family protein [Bacillota bacterium]